MPSPPTSSSSAAEPNLVTNDDDGVKEEEPKDDDKGIRKIHWNVDPNGSLIQTSVYSFEESHVTEMEIIDVTNNNDRSTSEHRDILHERALFKSPDPQIKKLPGETSKPTTTPKIAYATPAKVRQQFLDEMLNVTDRVDDISSHHGSLLQQSMIDSVGQNLPSIEWSVTDPQSALKSKQINNAATVIVAPNTSETTEYLTATDDNPYVLRINELEQNLCEQRTNTDELQDRLKSRVTQLEQALRVTAATPRGTIIQQNPLQTLLERNQTLVKEVRFADQTCVELSSKNSSLEKQIKELKRKVAALEVENGDLRIMNSERASMDAERIEHLEKELNRNQSSPGNRIDDVLSTIEDAFEQWRDKKTSEETHHDDYDAYGAASTASDIFSETEKSFLKPTKSTHNDDGTMNDFNIKIFEFVRNLLTEKNHVSGRTEEESDGGLDEQSKSRIENEFLGRQLGQVQEKLESTQKLLEAEYSRNDELETQLKRGAETYVRLIDPLEKRLLAVSQATSSLPQELVDTDSRLFDLQKELAHAKASLSAIKRESERMLADRRLTVEMVTKSKDNEELMLTIQNSFLRMSQQYKKLEVDVGSVVGNLASRIESMTATISFLRSSLLFDNDTAEVLRRPEDIGTRHPSQSPVGRGIPVSDGHIQQGGLIYIDNDDDVLELMEEARSPRKFEINIPGDIDDLTLESLVKSVSVLSPISHAERFKEPLEAAIRECQRVRERSSKLKEEIEKHIMTIHHLEGEKKHLTNSLQQREEDCRLLKQTVDLSKQQLEALDAALKASELEKSQVTQLKNNEKEALERDNVKLHAEARRLQNQETTLTKLLQENESKLVRIKTELNMMTQAHDDLVDKLTRSEKEHTERKDAELREATMSLQQAKDDLSKLRKSNQELLELHSQDKEENSRLSSKIRYIESKQESLISDLEDRDLEMQYMKEDIRKERAELKSELSQKEQEISSLKTAVSSAKMKCQVEEEEKQALISKIQAVAKIRADSCDRLEVHGICNDLSSMFFNSEFVLPESATSAIKEIEGLVKGLPYICSQLEDLHKESLRLSEFELEINNRNKQLELLEGREDELRKQNDELFSLLHQADTRVEESLEQVKVMQDTLIEIEQQKNAALEQASNAQAEMFEVRSKLQDDVAKSQAELNEVMDKVDTSCRALKRITEER
jgi:chromosome segregation ATPase